MSAAAAADLEREIRAICDKHGVTRQQLRGICEQLLREDGVEPVEPAEPEVVFRAVEEGEVGRR